MECSHPVIYTDEKGNYCLTCGARLDAEAALTAETDKDPSETEKPSEAAKKSSKRTTKTKAD